MSEPRPAVAASTGLVLTALAGSAAVGLAAWTVVTTLLGTSPVSWVLGRASGLTAYVLLLALVTTGLALSHPWVRGLRRPSPTARLRLHVALATFTLAFTVLHVVVLATDPWAQVGWRGALLPLASTYRPVPVTLGVLALWAGLLTGVTARSAGSIAARIWWPVHKVAAGILVLVWSHSVLAGSDTPTLRWFYVSTGVAVIGLAITRYGARTPADRVAELNRELATSVARAVPHAAHHDGAPR